jgi:hypothetical protein
MAHVLGSPAGPAGSAQLEEIEQEGGEGQGHLVDGRESNMARQLPAIDSSGIRVGGKQRSNGIRVEQGILGGNGGRSG